MFVYLSILDLYFICMLVWGCIVWFTVNKIQSWYNIIGKSRVRGLLEFWLVICKIIFLMLWCSGNGAGRINEVTLCRAQLVLGWVTMSGFDFRRWHFISVCNQPPRSTQPFILARSINWVVRCNRMFASSHGRRHLVNAYAVKAWCGWLGRWCVL